MFSWLFWAGLILAAPLSAQQNPPAAPPDPTVVNRHIDDRVRECGTPSPAISSWPAGERFRIEFRTAFQQPVDDRLASELETSEKRLLTGVLLPLGISVAPSTSASDSVIEVAGVGEALEPETPVPDKIYTGGSWRGVLSVQQAGRCLYALPFGSRLRPPDSVVTVAFADPAAAPYLEALETPLIEQALALAERLRGTEGLARIASSEADWRVRVGAVQRINDQNILAGLARASKAPWLRAAAVGRLTSQAKLDEVAQTDTDPDVRKAALDRLAELARQKN